MRSRDVFKCWPFPAGEATADQVHSWLPPMTVPTFRWWSDELNKIRSNRAAAVEQQNPPPEEERAVWREPAESEKSEEEENSPLEVLVSLREEGEEEKSELVCPVCRDFNAATLTAVNAHIDSCLREELRRMRISKSKSKSPRKKERSVSEICELEEQDDDNPPEQLQSETETAAKFSPFGEDVSVTVAKFRKLSRRLEALRSNNSSIGRKSVRSDGGRPNSEDPSSPEEEEGKLEMVCPVCRVFKGETATAAAANAHIDSCLAQAMREERLKQMRKRLSSNLKPKAPKKRSIAEILNVAPQIDAGARAVAAEVAREEEDDEDSGERVAIKSKKKRTTMKKVMKKKFKLGKRAGVVPPNDESKKKRKKKKTKKKKKNLFNNDLASKKACKSKLHNSVNRSIKLKGIGNKTSKLDGTDASCSHEKKLDSKILPEEKKEEVKNCDSVVGKQQNKAAASPILKNSKHISESSTSSGCNVQEGNNNEENQCDVQVPKDGDSFDDDDNNLVSNRNSDDVDNTAMVESKQFPNSSAMDQVGAQNFSKPCTTNQEEPEELVDKGESLSLSLFDKFHKGNTTPHHCSPYIEVSRSLSALQAGQISGKNTQLCESESGAFISTTRAFIDRLDDVSVQSANTRTLLEHSSSYSASYNKGNYERPESGLRAYGDNNGKALCDRPSSPYMFAADMIDNSPIFRGGQEKESVSDSRVNQNFFGFPLNSHGELIDFNSSVKVGMNQQDTSSCTLGGSSSQEHLTLSEKHVAQKTTLQDGANPFPVPHYPARLGVTTELHGGIGRADINHHISNRSSGRYDWLLNSELNLARSSPFSEQNQANNKTSNRNGNGIMVSPKGSSDLALPNSSQPTMRLMGKDVLIGGSSKEKQQSEVAATAIGNSLLGRCSKQDRGSGSQILQTPTDQNVLQSVKSQSTTFIKGNLGINSNIGSPNFHQAPDKLQWKFVSRDKPQALSFQSQVLPSPHPASSSSQGEHNERKSHHHVKTSPFGFPFLHPNVEEHAKTPLSRRSSMGLLPPWMLGSSHERLASFPHDVRGNSSATPSVNHSAQFQHHPNLRKAPLCPPYVPVNLAPLAKQPSASITSGCRNITEVIDLEKLNNDNHHHHHIHHHLHHHPCTITNTSRKRPAPPDFIDLTEPSKLPNLAFDSSNQDGGGGGGAAAAASCILRPSQNVDQDDSTRRNHSATDFGRDLELQRRLTKKYRF